MHLCRCWLILAAQISVLLGSLVLQQTPRYMQVQTNGTVTMSCDSSSSILRISWLKRSLVSSTGSHLELLALHDTQKGPKYSKVVEKRINTSAEMKRFIFRLTNVAPSDSGIYFCMFVGSPELIFGMGTQLSVVDALPTSAPPTKKPTPKKRVCRLPNPVTHKGPPCSLITLGLLLTGVLGLLLCLGMAIRRHYLRRRARLQFVKQFYR